MRRFDRGLTLQKRFATMPGMKSRKTFLHQPTLSQTGRYYYACSLAMDARLGAHQGEEAGEL